MTELCCPPWDWTGTPIALMGVPFDPVTTNDALAWIERAVASRTPHYLVTANVDFLVQARRDLELRRILIEADLVVCDGMPLVWASRLLGNSLPERVAGADLVPKLIDIAARRNYRIFFLGGRPESVSRAIARMRARHPQLEVSGYSPKFQQLLEMDHETIRRKIAEARPDVLFVCFGCPKQEKWIAMHYRALGVPVCAGVGGTIDFLAGQLKRAPVWMQKVGLEWLFRLAQEPGRLVGRYGRDLGVFGLSLLAQWWRCRGVHWSRGGREGAPGVKRSSNASWRCLEMPEWVDAAAVLQPGPLHDLLLPDGRHCLVKMDAVKFIDSTGVGALIGLQKASHAAGRELVLVAPSRSVLRTLKLMRLESLFACEPDLKAALHLIRARSHERHACVRLRTEFIRPTICWFGEVTAANVSQVGRLTESCGKKLSSPVTIDLSAVRFIDSSGVDLMLRLRRSAEQRGVVLNFLGAQAEVREVMGMVGVEEVVLEATA